MTPLAHDPSGGMVIDGLLVLLAIFGGCVVLAVVLVLTIRKLCNRGRNGQANKDTVAAASRPQDREDR